MSATEPAFPDLPFSEEEVLVALGWEGRERPAHRVIDVLAEERYGILTVIENARTTESNAINHHLKHNLGFLADRLEKLGNFSLEPFDAIAIWSYMSSEGIEGYFGHHLSSMLGVAYAIATLDQDHWAGTVRAYLETSQFPERLLEREKDLTVILSRIDEVDVAIDLVDQFRKGHTFGTRDFNEAVLDGDTDIGKYIALENERMDLPYMGVLGDLRENFGNGFIYVRHYVAHLLGQD